MVAALEPHMAERDFMGQLEQSIDCTKPPSGDEQ